MAGDYTYDDILIPPFRELSNLVNNIRKKALQFTYDDKGNKLNDIAPPNMKTYYQSLKSCFVLSMFFFATFRYAIMRIICLHPNDRTVLEKATQIIQILFHKEILQFFEYSSSQESLCKKHIIFGNRNIILRHMPITNATDSKLNQFIEPKTTFAAFLSVDMKDRQACRKW